MLQDHWLSLLPDRAKNTGVLQLAHQGLLAMHLRHSTSPSQLGQLVTPPAQHQQRQPSTSTSSGSHQPRFHKVVQKGQARPLLERATLPGHVDTDQNRLYLLSLLLGHQG